MSENYESTIEVENKLKSFIDSHVDKVAPLEKEQNLVYWDASLTGKEESYNKYSELETRIREIYSDPDDFRLLKEIRNVRKVEDPLLKRQLEILFLGYQGNQIDPVLMKEIVTLASEIENEFGVYRGEIDGEEVTDNDIDQILKSDNDSARREKAWLTYTARGALVRDKVLKLVGLRNRAARDLGYSNHYEMSLVLQEQDPDEIKAIFDNLAEETQEPFTRLMDQINRVLAERYGVEPGELKPWHYEDPHFQEAPTIGSIDLDPIYKDVDLESLVGDFYSQAGIDAGEIIARSDLYEKKGKMPHAYCMYVDRKDDVRVLCNMKNNERWTGVFLHEMGHGVYDKYIDPGLPWLLREPSHSFTTEAIAELFGRLIHDPNWLSGTLDVSDQKLDSIKDHLRFNERMAMLIMARWTIVVTNFERELYTNPDQDLNSLWWDLKQRYQLLTPPSGRDEPDWAAKIHIACWPVYYHNYMLGQMMASQLIYYMAEQILKVDNIKEIDFLKQSELGAYMIEKIFKPGRRLRWDQLLIEGTGETLKPGYFTRQFVG
jgi:peptidyl-dipeptidase A